MHSENKGVREGACNAVTLFVIQVYATDGAYRCRLGSGLFFFRKSYSDFFPVKVSLISKKQRKNTFNTALVDDRELCPGSWTLPLFRKFGTFVT